MRWTGFALNISSISFISISHNRMLQTIYLHNKLLMVSDWRRTHSKENDEERIERIQRRAHSKENVEQHIQDNRTKNAFKENNKHISTREK